MLEDNDISSIRISAKQRGKLPDNLFLERSRELKDVNWHSAYGKEPFKRLPRRCKIDRDGIRSLMLWGRGPESKLSERSKSYMLEELVEAKEPVIRLWERRKVVKPDGKAEMRWPVILL